MLIVGARRVLGVTLPPLKHFGPMLVVWGASMFMLVFIRDLGSSLMFFAAFLRRSDEAGTPVQKWTLGGVAPMKYTGPTLAAKGGGDVAMEELVLSSESMDTEALA